MVRCFPRFYIELYIICTVQMVICIELYKYNLDTNVCAFKIVHYRSSESFVMSLS